jgi:hypothetical protein
VAVQHFLVLKVVNPFVALQTTLGQGGVVAAGAAAAAPAAAANGGPPAAGAAAGGAELATYDKLLSEQLQPFISHATAIGGEVRSINVGSGLPNPPCNASVCYSLGNRANVMRASTRMHRVQLHIEAAQLTAEAAANIM